MRRLVLGSLAIFVAIGLNAKTVATVNGMDVTEADVTVILRALPGGQNAVYNDIPAEYKQQAIDQAIDRKLLMTYALKNGIEQDAEYKKTLENVKKEIGLEIWMKREFEKTKVTEAQIKEYYKNNDQKLMQPPRVKASHILLEKESDAKKIIDELAKLKGEKLEDKFADFARKQSIDPGGQNGGELGWFAENQMVPEFSTVAFALKKGEVTKTPVSTKYGFHVIYLEDKQDAKKVDYEDAKIQIESMLRAEEFRKSVSNNVKSLRDKAKIEIKK